MILKIPLLAFGQNGTSEDCTKLGGTSTQLYTDDCRQSEKRDFDK